MVELLIVIGILGILAAGLLAAIDPLEQLKKGRDTQARGITVEYSNALTRYYAIYGSMPWGTGATGPVSLSSVANGVTQTLIDVGELKTEFNRGLPGSTGGKISLIGASAGDVYLCFDPESKAISADPSTIFTSTANPPATAASTCAATAVCYYCAH